MASHSALRVSSLLTLLCALLVAAPVAAEPDGRAATPDAEATRLAEAIAVEPNPAVALAKVESLQRLESHLTRTRYLQLLEQTAAEADSPLVAFRLRRTAARVRVDTGNFEHGRDGMKGPLGRQGCLTRWKVAGPFDNDNMQAYGERLGPENGQSGPYEGKIGQIDWRTMPDFDDFCAIRLGRAVEPTTAAVAYLSTEIEVDRSVDARLLVGATGAYKVWVDGELVGRQSENLGMALDNQAWSVDLEKGRHRVLVKLASQSNGSLGFAGRLVDADLKPVAGLTQTPAWSPEAVQPADDTEGPTPTDQGVRARAKACAQGEGTPAAWCTWLWRRAESATAANPWRDAATRLLADPKVLTGPDVARLSELLDDHWRRLDLLERAAQMAPDDPWLAADLAGAYGSSLGKVERTKQRRRLEQLVDDHPDFWPATVELADWYDRRGLARKALAMMRGLQVDDRLDRPAILRRLANLEAQVGHRQEARRLQERLGAMQRLTSNWAWQQLSDLTATGETKEALKLVRRQRKLSPDSRAWGLEEAELLRAMGKTDEAMATIEAMIARQPGDVELRRQKAELLVALDRRPEAVALLEEAAERHPQSKSIRDFLSFLQPRENQFHEPWMRDDLRELADAHQAGSYAWETLVDQTIIRVAPNGLSQRVIQRVDRVNTGEGVDKAKTHSVSFTRGDERVDVLSVTVHKPDGTVLEDYDQWQSGSGSSGGSYYNDTRYLNMRANNVEEGDLVEFRYRVRQVANENFRGDYFGDIAYVESSKPIAYSRYVIESPVTWDLYFRSPSIEHTALNDELPGGGEPPKGFQVDGYEMSDIAPVQTDSSQPGYTDVYDYILVSNKKTYDEVGQWWWNLVEEQLIVNDEIRQAVAEQTKGLESDRAKVEALHNYVVRNTRYLHVGLGIHGWKPYRTTQCFSNKYGDCKDKASLLKVMLEEAGVKTNLVLVRTRRMGSVEEHPASMHIFNHAINYVPSLDLYLDPTAEFNGTTELTPMDQGAQALIVEDGGASKWVTLPVDEANDNRLEQTMEVDLGGEQATTSGHLVAYGQNAVYYRRTLEDPERRDEVFEKQLSNVYPGAQLVEARYKNLDALEKPVEIHFEFKGGRIKRQNNDKAFIFPYGAPKDLLDRYAKQAKRNQDLKIRVPFANETEMRYRLPADKGFERVPESVEIESEFGSLTIDYTKKGSSLVADIRYSIDTQRVSVEDYPTFRSFLSDVTAALNETIALTEEE